MTEDREERMEALRARVKQKKEAALSGGIIEEELVVSTSGLEESPSQFANVKMTSGTNSLTWMPTAGETWPLFSFWSEASLAWSRGRSSSKATRQNC